MGPTCVDAVECTGAPETTLAASVSSSFAISFEPGSTIGRYVVEDLIGSGGMGDVYRAFDPELKRCVAVKVLRRGRVSTDPNAHARVAREARAMASLSHPNVLPVFDVGIQDGLLFIAMAFIEGMTLRQWLSDEQRSVAEVVAVYRQAAEGLAAAHAQSIVHRDFKPDNVLIDGSGRVYVLDFGLARGAFDRSDDSESGFAPTADGELETLTETGAVMGTPAYMAPEQHLGHVATTAADQFAFFTAFFEGIHGHRPFTGDSYATLAQAKYDGRVQPVDPSSRVPAWLNVAISRGLATRPEDRYPSMHDVLRQALPVITSRGRLVRPNRRRGFAMMGVAAATVASSVGMMAAVGGSLSHPQRCMASAETLADVWGPTQRDAVHRGLVATGVPYATTASTRVGVALDAYASSWAEQHDRVCAALATLDTSGEEQKQAVLDNEMACLRRRLVSLEELVTQLSHADPKVVSQSVEAARRLPSTASCGNEAREQRNEHHEVIAIRLAEAAQQYASGRLTEASATGKAALAEARMLDERSLAAQAHLIVGQIETAQASYAAAETSLSEAYWLAASEREHRIAAEAAAGLVFVVGYALHREHEARDWLRHARAAQERLAEHHPMLEITLLDHTAIMLTRVGQPKEAADLARRAVAVVEESSMSDAPELAHVNNTLAIALIESGEYAAASDALLRARQIWQESLGPTHPKVAQVLLNLGVIARRQGDYSQALAYHAEALQVAEAGLGADHPMCAMALLNMANVESNQGRTAEALEHLERALQIAETGSVPDQALTARIYHSQAAALLGQDALADAEQAISQALMLYEMVGGPEHIDVAQATSTLADVLVAKGEVARGHALFVRTIDLIEKVGGPDHPAAIGSLLRAADIAMQRGDHDETIERSTRALAIAEQHGMLREVWQAKFLLARVYWSRGRRDEALELARKALAAHERHHFADEEHEFVRRWVAQHS